jgi:hypothetical protein
VTRTTTTQMIEEQLPNLNSRKRLVLKPKLDLERSLLPSFLKKKIHSIGDCRWILKRLQAVRRERLNQFFAKNPVFIFGPLYFYKYFFKNRNQNNIKNGAAENDFDSSLEEF